ncbi:MAG: HD domain-containing protein [Phycisphaerae bacterium]|jgi:HD-GYP domain-containing protein (c-di-GMP phosphodiesterase class II)|nr:HD domain-containing protein [Phycisphaerae bacterium]
MTLPVRFRADPRRHSLADEVRSLGGIWIECDDRGVVHSADSGERDLLTNAFLHSTPFQHLLRVFVPGLMSAGAGATVEPLAGLYMFASVLPEEGPHGIGVAIFPTLQFAFSDDLRRLASSTAVDPGVLSQMILTRDPIEPRELHRIASLVRFAHRSERERAAESRCSASVGQQLAATYEELNLLYTMIAGGAVSEEPSAFLAMTCDELVRTIGVAWVAVRVRSPLDRFVQPDGLLVAGTPPVDRSVLLDLSTRLLVAQGAEASRIYPQGHPTLTFLNVDGPLVVCPIRRERSSNGILLVGHSAVDTSSDAQAHLGSADVKLAEAAAAHLGMHLENASLYRDLDSMFLGTLDAMVTAIDAKDPYTRGHSQRVALLSQALARSIGIDEAGLRVVHIAGLVHDIGKIGVAEAVLRKPGRLDDTEFAQIRQHPEIGWRILKDIPQFREMLDGVLSHHERWDGRGYPHGLRGEQIPLIARIIALADSFDAMGSNRTYRSGRPREQVLDEIRACAGKQFDPDLVGPFLALDFNEYDALHAEHEAQERASRLAA